VCKWLAIFFCNFTFSYVYASCDTTTYPHQTLTDIRIIFDVPNLSYLLKYRRKFGYHIGLTILVGYRSACPKHRNSFSFFSMMSFWLINKATPLANTMVWWSPTRTNATRQYGARITYNVDCSLPRRIYLGYFETA
jgi:hypothetical protein